MKDSQISKLLKQLESGYSLPALSPVVMKLVELASDEKSSSMDLVSLIDKDPPLAARLLRLANSAFFSSRDPVSALNQAVVRIGFKRLRVMALSISLRDTFPMGKVGPLNYEKFWTISLYRALISKSLADTLKSSNTDEAFTAGLLMEIGLLIFFDIFIKGKNEEVGLDLESIEDLLAWERDKYSLDHRQIGEIALKYWNFPENIVLCQRADKTSVKNSEQAALIQICEQAGSLSKLMFMKSFEFHSLYDEVEKFPGLTQDMINDILIYTFEKVEEIAASLSVEINKEKDLLAIMEKANQALGRISEKISTQEVSSERPIPPSFASLEQGGEDIKQTLHAVAHEIRNPLLAVGGFAKRLSDSLDPSSKGGKYVQIILREASRLEMVLSEMTDTNRKSSLPPPLSSP
ncbi:MAG: HDOD domain-containing protein [Deltaproteobacteria bacterium]|nr:HDOD domain-containing protein [Deltaproteobacteria bacterium]